MLSNFVNEVHFCLIVKINSIFNPKYIRFSFNHGIDKSHELTTECSHEWFIIHFDASWSPIAIDFVFEENQVSSVLFVKKSSKPASRSEERREDLIASSWDTIDAQTTSLEFASRNFVISQGLEESENIVRSMHIVLLIGGNFVNTEASHHEPPGSAAIQSGTPLPTCLPTDTPPGATAV
jgi:hypothetical protein